MKAWIKLFIFVCLTAGASSITWAGDYVEYTGRHFKDPFFHYQDASLGAPVLESVKEAESSLLELEGLVWDSDIPQAIINQKARKIGDKIGDAEILEISREGVKLLRGGVTEIFLTNRRNKQNDKTSP